MPVIRSKTFQIPLSKEPKKNDVMMLAMTGMDNSYTSVMTSIYNGSSWTTFSTDVLYENKPSYANGFINFSVTHTNAITPFKATYVTGWEDS